MSGSWESAMVDEALRLGPQDTTAHKTIRQAGGQS